MLRLHQTFGAHAGRVREIDQEVVRFGRLPTNDYVFDAHADLDASGNHAELRREGGKWVLVDVGSRNGTLVHGRAVQRYVLEGNEEIEFGTGGPRVRIEIVPGAGGRGAPTAPATPISPPMPQMGASPSARPGPPAPASAAQVPTPVWGPKPAPPIGPPGIASTPAPIHSPIPPSAHPPPMQPGASPGGGPGSGAPKLYGARTVEQMIQSAVSQAQSSPGFAPPTPAPSVPGSSGKPHDTAYIRQVAEDAAGQRSRGMVFVLAIVLVLFVLTLCGVSGIIALLWTRAFG